MSKAKHKADKSEETPSRVRRPRTPWILRLFGSLISLTFLTVFVLGIGAGVSYYTVVHFIRRHEVEVPNLTRKTTAEALEILGPHNLSLALESSEYHDLIPEGAILRQHPRPGSSAKTGTPVHVVLSRGPEYSAVPEVMGLSVVDAGIALRARDLGVGVISHLRHPTLPVDTVVSQSPLPGEGLRRGQPVDLLVSLGPPVPDFAAPDLTGMTLPEARDALDLYGCTIGEVTERSAPEGALHGTVLEQLPTPGAAMPAGSAVDLVLARRL